MKRSRIIMINFFLKIYVIRICKINFHLKNCIAEINRDFTSMFLFLNVLSLSKVSLYSY